MSGSGGFSVSRTGAGDHIGSYSNVDREVDQVVQQSQLRVNNRRNDGMAVTDVENVRIEFDEVDGALSVPMVVPSSCGAGPSRLTNSVTNLGSFLDSVTPVVPAHTLMEANASCEAGIRAYYSIGDLWEAFQEWSAYGAGVPFLLNGIHPTTQYYVPFLSGMQLYIDPKKLHTRTGSPAEAKVVESHEPNQQTDLVSDGSFASLNLNRQKLKQVTLRDDKTKGCGSRGILAFEYMEQERPYTRKPLFYKASVLESQFPELSKYRSCDLSPSSWICVAWYSSYLKEAKWYPIYRIPVGPTLEDLEASFLTLHSLSTQPGSYYEVGSSNRNAHGVDGEHGLSTVRLPVIGLASYKLNGSIISPCDPQEREQENALLKVASNWLQNLQPLLPDYQFFLNRYSS